MQGTWKQCTHIFINTSTWCYARSIFLWPIITTIKNITDHICFFMSMIYFGDTASLYVFWLCMRARYTPNTDPQGSPEEQAKLTYNLLWNSARRTSVIMTGGSTWPNFPPSANACPCMTFLESRIELITWAQVLGLDSLASVYNTDSKCTMSTWLIFEIGVPLITSFACRSSD